MNLGDLLPLLETKDRVKIMAARDRRGVFDQFLAGPFPH